MDLEILPTPVNKQPAFFYTQMNTGLKAFAALAEAISERQSLWFSIL
jgi:hypothetical protein